jgi:regulator of protease activity HflC (stomatin/prohibitin superfamily)
MRMRRTNAAAGRKVSKAAEAEARRVERQARLAPLYEAIRQGRAYLDTAFGRHTVLSYNDETGNAVTVPEGKSGYLHQRTFMVCSDGIKVS